MNSKLILRLKL